MKVFTEALAVAGLPTEAGAKSTSTEAALFQQAGYDALVFGPGAPIGNSHGPNEQLLLEQIDRGIAFYSKLIEKVCI
jgi:acetylornithine deacetylase/succinyl-diaminopimelate desuccinylase-like protein